MSAHEREKLDNLPEVQLRNLTAKGPKEGMRGSSQASKKQLVDYLINHPTIRPARWTSEATGSAAAAPPAKRARPNPQPVPAPSQPADPTILHPQLDPGPATLPCVFDPIRGMLYPYQRMPIHDATGETPAQEAERRAGEWASISAALDIEEEAEDAAYDSEDDDDSEDGLEDDVAKAEKREIARQYREELVLRGDIRVQEHWRRTDEVTRFESGLVAAGGLTPAILAEFRRQDQRRQEFWKEEDRRRDEFWRDEDRRRNEVWEDRRDGY